jgi:hypothetical protein
MYCSFKTVRRRGKKVSAWSSLAYGGGTLLDIFGVSAESETKHFCGSSLRDDSKKLRDDARAVGHDFAHVLRSAVDR